MNADDMTALGLHGLSEHEVRDALRELCARGLLTCTRGEPGADGATYALAWLPLDDAAAYPPTVRRLHERNRQRLDASGLPFPSTGGEQ